MSTIYDLISALPDRAAAAFQGSGRPFVTVSYAQSLDGSIAIRAGQDTRISGEESMAMTHYLRTSHAGILVGIGTILADDPRLTVRIPDMPDAYHPRPIVLDSRLRFPVTARLLDHPEHAPIIFTLPQLFPAWSETLEAAGADITSVAADSQNRIDLHSVLFRLAERGITSVLVEGGAQVITSFLKEGLVDLLVVTVTPTLLGGYNALTSSLAARVENAPRLAGVIYEQMGDDLIVWGEVT